MDLFPLISESKYGGSVFYITFTDLGRNTKYSTKNFYPLRGALFSNSFTSSSVRCKTS